MVLHVNDNRFMSDDEQSVCLRGIGLGCHLNLEHFMLGIPGTNTEIRSALANVYGNEKAKCFFDTYYRNYVADADLSFLKSLGINCIRIPINAHGFSVDDAFEASAALAELDRVIALCRSHQMYAVLDMHAAYAPQNPDWHSDNNTGDYGFFKNPEARAETAALWGLLASRYKSEKWVGGYDLLNEPCYFEPSLDAVLLEFYDACIGSIRREDTAHLLFLEGNTYARDFTMFSHNLDDNSAYTFHYYPFLQLPDSLNAPDLRALLETSLHRDVTLTHLTETLRRPLWCGETGHPLHLPDTAGVTAVFLELLESMQISWALWPIKDARAMGLLYPKEHATFLALVRKVTSGWRFFDSFNEDSILAAEGAADRHAFYRALAQNSTSALHRFEEALRHIPFDTFLASLDDFRFEHCAQNAPLAKGIERDEP